MRRSLRWLPAVLVMAGATLVGPPREAHAILALAADVGGGAALVFAVDNNVIPPGYTPGPGYNTQLVDMDPTVGVLSLGAAAVNVGGLLVSGSLHEQTKATVSGGNNALDSGSLTVVNPTGAAITAVVAVSATNYQGQSFEVATSGSGTWRDAAGSTIAMEWWNDPANGQGAEDAFDTPGNLVDSFTDTAVGPVDSFSHTTPLTPLLFPDLGAYSMSLQFEFTLVGGGRLISRGQTQIKPTSLIPEPGSMVMAFMAAPLLGLGYYRHRRRARA